MEYRKRTKNKSGEEEYCIVMKGIFLFLFVVFFFFIFIFLCCSIEKNKIRSCAVVGPRIVVASPVSAHNVLCYGQCLVLRGLLGLYPPNVPQVCIMTLSRQGFDGRRGRDAKNRSISVFTCILYWPTFYMI